MVDQEELYPDFPKMECVICHQPIEVIRKWMNLGTYGAQIVINWQATDNLTQIHMRMHTDDLITGAEEFLRADARRRGA